MAEWRPIESAPKDGTEVLLFIPGRRAELGWWYESQEYAYGKLKRKTEKWMWGSGMQGILSMTGDAPPEPTHWMPLPEPPHA